MYAFIAKFFQALSKHSNLAKSRNRSTRSFAAVMQRPKSTIALNNLNFIYLFTAVLCYFIPKSFGNLSFIHTVCLLLLYCGSVVIDCWFVDLEQETYTKQFRENVYSKPLVNLYNISRDRLRPDVKAVRLEYHDLDSFRQLTSALGLMTDCKVRLGPDDRQGKTKA